MSKISSPYVSPCGKFRYELQNNEAVRDKDGRLLSTNLQKIYRIDRVSDVLVATLEHRDGSHWFMQNKVQYLLCPYRNDAVVGKNDSWTTTWFRKTYIVNCETGKQIAAPIVSHGRGFFGFDFSSDGNFLISHSYDGYNNTVSICNISNLEENVARLVNIHATASLPEHDYHVYDIGRERVVYLTQYWFEEQNKALSASTVFYVPEVYECLWMYNEIGSVSGLKMTTTCEYIIRSGFAFTYATHYNMQRAKNENFDSEEDVESLKVEWATATFELDKENCVFKQTCLLKFPHVDMPETSFNNLFKLKCKEDTGNVDAWGRL